jgi:hypothetical protein
MFTGGISMEEIEKLKEHSKMLGQIAAIVEEYCLEEDTTLDGVKALKEDLLSESRWAAYYCRKLVDARRLGYLPDDFKF